MAISVPELFGEMDAFLRFPCETRHSHEGAGNDPEGLKRSSRSDAITPSGLPAGSPRGSAF